MNFISANISKAIKLDIILWSFTIMSIFISYNLFVNKAVNIFNKNPVSYNSKKKTPNIKVNIKKKNNLFSAHGIQTYDASHSILIIKEFNRLNYSLKGVAYGEKVPNIQPSSIPKDLINILDIRKRKNLFIKMMLPMALDINESILQKKVLLNKIIKKYSIKKTLSNIDKANLKHWGLEFRVDINYNKLDNALKHLKHRIHPIPVDLILAQAIVESGWGTSRFAIVGNALFGQWTYSKSNGILPNNRDAEKTHSIKSFPNPYQSMKSYVANLNRHNAYKKLRSIRQELSSNGGTLTGTALANGLHKYSEERLEYVKKIQLIIKSNNLNLYNNASLNNK